MADHPFMPNGFHSWAVSIPQGNYRIAQGERFYQVEYRPFLGPPEEVVRINHTMYDADAWARVAIAVTRHANRQMR